MNEEKLEHIVDTHEKRINDHGERLDKLELQNGRLEMLQEQPLMLLDAQRQGQQCMPRSIGS